MSDDHIVDANKMVPRYRLKADRDRRAMYTGPDPYQGQLAEIICQGPGPGPRNTLVRLVEGGLAVVLIRRDKSLFCRAEPPATLELFK